jgi:hypothetical protein
MEDLKGQDELVLESLLKFYEKNPEYLKVLENISNQKSLISLREIDYTVTNYGRDKPIIYKLKNGMNFNLYLDYKRQLRGYSKRTFDPFCRRQRIFVNFDLSIKPVFINDEDLDKYKKNDTGLITTIGQLNFFKWAISNEVIEYCLNNKDLIIEDMNRTDSEKTVLKSKSNKRQLSKNNKSVHIEKTRVIIQFP